ncbi:Protein EFR3 [Verticillium dahliae VDG1]|nr:Protein EFR3 [Verticillium dahliae VDG1]
MCTDQFHGFLQALPKCEHHVHIEGTLSPELLFQLAEKNGVTLPSDTDAAFASPSALRARYREFKSLDDFLQYYYTGFSVLLTTDDFADLAYAYLAIAHAQSVRHAEVFFDPQAHTSRGVSYVTVIEGLSTARRRAAVDFPQLFNINSDDPAYFGGYILENYCAVHDAFDLSVDEWAGVAMGAVEGSWCDEARKAVLRAEVEQVVGEWRGRLAMV